MTGADLPGAAEASAAERDAAKEKGPTTYVLLRWWDSAEADSGDGKMDVELHGVWEEIDRIEAAGRPAAWEDAKRNHPFVVPAPAGKPEQFQLVPERFWRRFTSYNDQPPPAPRVEGL